MLSSLLGRLLMPASTNALPEIGETERAALESGTVGFEGRFFEGKADFARLAAIRTEQLTDDERAFLDLWVPELCAMLDEFAIDEARDLPPEVWHYLRKHQFFGMIIPRAYGGLEFSHATHAAVVTRIASVNIAAAVTVMVPNSLGPGRTARALWYGGTKEPLLAPPCEFRGSAMFCADLTLCRIGRRRNSRHRGVDKAGLEWRPD